MRKKTVIVFLLGLICGLALMGGLMRQDQRLDAEAAPQDTVVSAVPQEAADSQKGQCRQQFRRCACLEQRNGVHGRHGGGLWRQDLPRQMVDTG